MTTQERITWVTFRTAWFLCARLPEAWVKRAFVLFADIAILRKTAGALRLQFNLARATGISPESREARNLAQAAMRSYMLYYADLFRLGVYSFDDLSKRARFVNREILDNPIAQGRGAVVIITHSGNWDLAGAYVGTQFKDVTSVAERLRPEKLFRAFVDVRARYGVTVLPHKGGTRPPSETLLEKLQQGHIIALASDRDFTRKGVGATFFGHQATFPTGAIRLAQRTGAPLIFAAIWTDKDVAVLELHQPIEVGSRSDEDIMRDVVQHFENAIKNHPENWHMLQQIWPDHPVEWGGRRR